ncbi:MULTISPECIES: 5-deoxy-glucuronate isomerase [unclassified Sphingopyxis]|jgi:5-deoxy-glucuronate isomerase|uniref:5-deoxy-glucuronate isomerase n=1 Tax=unclassified Sphingopyxis TaxID=2614943 RepID=UPI00086BE64D|nr:MULTISPECIES: 5-deoxy-glucuronate isomerase [unclassified Sphingopyxis]ODU33689.1 MAG: 5-deoxy-glucuronate isomerase [Sphingopyxis sp. SCN 67-31]
MSLLVHPHSPAGDGTVLDITPESAGWKYVGFRVVRLAAGASYNRVEDGREACVVVLTGTVSIMAGGESFENIGGRQTVFDGAATSVYVPAGHRYRIEAVSDAEIAICTAPGTGAGAVRLIRSDAVEVRGQGTNKRHVRNILSDADAAESLLVVEVITPGGHWSSYPPHKHDRDAYPEETFLEETYYHRLSPSQGFAFQRVYTDERDIDETMAVEDGDVVMVPRGYHPVGAPHGYDLYYLNVMAGPRRNWVFRNDPAHEWIVRQ